MENTTGIRVVKRKGSTAGKRKDGLNNNREGSVRNINGMVYVDFMYLGERVREKTGLPWNERNIKRTRNDLDKIIVKVRDGSFRFAEVFPDSRRKDYFAERERQLLGRRRSPGEVFVKDYLWAWYKTIQESGRIMGRTLRDYKGYLNNYIEPFLGDLTFADLNKVTFDKFIAWARSQKLKDKVISNTTVNKIFKPLKQICVYVSVDCGWGNNYNPFFGFKNLKEDDPYEKIFPFSVREQKRIIRHTPEHWRLYIKFAFCCGLRPGEQLGLKPGDIDWAQGLLNIRRAITYDENGKVIEGKTKNQYSRRTIKLTKRMKAILGRQKAICDQLGSEYLFCTLDGKRIDLDNFRKRVWIPVLTEAQVPYRDLKQTRHTFATIALKSGLDPLAIANMMGHRDTKMLLGVYGKYNSNHSGRSPLEPLDKIFAGKKKKVSEDKTG